MSESSGGVPHDTTRHDTTHHTLPCLHLPLPISYNTINICDVLEGGAPRAGNYTLNKADCVTIETGLVTASNKGIEGITWDPSRNCFYLILEKYVTPHPP